MPGQLWVLPVLLLLLLSHEGQEEESHCVQELEQEGVKLSW